MKQMNYGKKYSCNNLIQLSDDFLQPYGSDEDLTEPKRRRLITWELRIYPHFFTFNQLIAS